MTFTSLIAINIIDFAKLLILNVYLTMFFLIILRKKFRQKTIN